MNDSNSKMKLATAHTLTNDNFINDPIPSFDRCFSTLKKAGFDRVNIDFCDICQKGEWMNVDSWEDTVAEIAELSKKHALPVYQTHSNSYHGKDWDDPAYEKHEFMEWSNLRCIKATAMLGGKYIVIHPKNLPHGPLYSAKKAKEANLSYLEPFINEAKKCGVSIAVENMVDFRGNRRRYCGGDIYELIDLVDTINDKDVGICLDTGHANIGGADPAAAILEIGSRLKATHINDNHAKEDEHLLPYFGNIDWAAVISALKAVGYQGDFAFELNALKNLPSDIYPDWLAYSAALGRKLMNSLDRLK